MSPSSFKASELVITRTDSPKPKPDSDDMAFGKHYSDHIFVVRHENGSWGAPEIKPFAPIPMHPASHVLHYGTSCFEGMKAFANNDGELRLFRPELNMARLHRSSRRIACADYDPEELLSCLKELVRLDGAWVPAQPGFSAYLRPMIYDDSPVLGLSAPSTTVIMVMLCPCGPYFPSGLKPIKLFLDEVNVRAWPGGVGDCKLASNYAPSVVPTVEAQRHGCSMPLFLLPQGDDPEEAIFSECGAMNVFFLLEDATGGLELVTPPLDGTILPGVTRRSVLELCTEWAEFKVSERAITLSEVRRAFSEGRLKCMFGCGTAAVVVPVDTLKRENGEVISVELELGDEEGSLVNRITKTITGIQTGKIPSAWSVLI